MSADTDDRDERLIAALRHAPDSDARPPDGLSARIAAVARDAARSGTATARDATRAGGAAPRRAPRWWLSPPWAGGLAAAAVAGFTILLWHDQPLPEPDAPPPAHGASADRPAAMKATPTPNTSSVPTLVAPEPPARAPAEAAPRQARSRDEAPLAQRGSAPAQAAETAAVASERDAIASTPTPPSPLPPPTLRPAAPAAAGPAAPAGEVRRADAATGNTELRSTPAKAAVSPAAAPPSLRALLDPASPLDGVARNALARIDSAARGRWQRVADAGVAEAAAPLRPWPGGATLAIESQGLRWTEPDGTAWFAPLDGAALEALR